MAGKEAAVEKILAAYYKEIIKKAKEFVRELSQKEGPGAI
jgi:hypothetical protein